MTDTRTALGTLHAESIVIDALDVSVMDGFAVRLADISKGKLPISGDALIGTPPISLAPASAARIVTGAPIPFGAVCVIRVEDITVANSEISFSPAIEKSLPPNRFIRRKGESGSMQHLADVASRVWSIVMVQKGDAGSDVEQHHAAEHGERLAREFRRDEPGW